MDPSTAPEQLSKKTDLRQLAPHADAAVGHLTAHDKEQVVWRQPEDARLGQLGDGGDDPWWTGRTTAAATFDTCFHSEPFTEKQTFGKFELLNKQLQKFVTTI